MEYAKKFDENSHARLFLIFAQKLSLVNYNNFKWVCIIDIYKMISTISHN